MTERISEKRFMTLASEKVASQKRLAELEQEFQVVAYDKGNLERDLKNAKGRLTSFKDGIKKREQERSLQGLGDTPAYVKREQEAELESLKTEVEKSEEVFLPVSQRLKQLNSEINTLGEKYRDFSEVISPSEVFEIQERISNVQITVAELELALCQVNKEIDEECNNVTVIDKLNQKRESVLAQIATGKAKEIDLQRIDEKLSSFKTTVETKAACGKDLASLEQAQSGLVRQINTAQQELSRMKDEVGPYVLEHFLRNQTELACQSYINMAQELTEKYRQLVGLSSLLRTTTNGKHNPLSLNWDELKIPMFNLEACSDVKAKATQGFLYRADIQLKLNHEASQARQNFREIGVTLL